MTFLLNRKSTMRRFALLATVACLWVCAVSGTARADQVVFNSFGPGDSYDSALLHVAGSGAGMYEAVAIAFTPSASANLTSISFPAQGLLDVNMVLAKDSGSDSPGSALETFSSIALGADTILTVNSVLHPSLTAGTTYWLEMLPTDPNTFGFGGWNGTNPNVAGDEAQQDIPNGFWQTIPTSEIAAFDVRGTVATPEPGSLSLLASGAVALIGFGGLKRKRAAR